MTKEQIQYLKSIFCKNKDNRPLAFSTTTIFNDHNALNNRKDLVIWDDAHELLYGVKVNEDPQSQTIAPIKITSCSYDILFFIDCLYNTTDFIEDVVDKQFSFLSGDLREAIKEWARKLPIQGNKLDRKVPYYTDDITIVQNLNTVDEFTREDYKDKEEENP